MCSTCGSAWAGFAQGPSAVRGRHRQTPAPKHADSSHAGGSLMVDQISWSGAVLLSIAYALVSCKRLDGAGIRFQFLNVAGAALFVVNSTSYGAYPSASLNVIWVVIGLVAITRKVGRRPGKEQLLETSDREIEHRLALRTSARTRGVIGDDCSTSRFDRRLFSVRGGASGDP